MYLIERVKKSAFGVVVFCTIAVACARHEDTGGVGKWVRTIEPRLSHMPTDGVIPVCDAEIRTHDEALRLLAGRPGCTEKAIAALKWIAKSTPEAWTDVAAAYCVRAQSHASDYLNALDAADQAVRQSPQLPAARFNRALALEKLGLIDDAISAWDDFLAIDKSSGAAGGTIHRNQLVRDRNADAVRVWERNKPALSDAMKALDRGAIARLIAPFPSTAERYLLDDLPLEWKSVPTAGQLEQLTLLARELSRLTGDLFDVDVIKALARAPRKLWPGHLAYAEARHKLPNTKPTSFQKASHLLAGSPLRFLADVGSVPGLSWEKPAEALALLDKLELEAQRVPYGSLLARIASAQGYCKLFSSHYFDALVAYESALERYKQIHDDEGILACHTRKTGIYTTVGQQDFAWAEAAAAMTLQLHVVETRSKHALLGETAAAAFGLGHPAVALRYQDLAVQLTKSDKDTAQLSSALRGRAELELQVHQFRQARLDLNEAKGLAAGKKDERVRDALDAHILDVDGRSNLIVQPALAAEAFTRALAAARNSQDQTVVATLLAERAEAEVLSGDLQSAEADLRNALDTLRKEENGNLEKRQTGFGDQVWSAYLSRFQRTYRLLIRRLAESKHTDEAFEYAEKARAYDLLNLVHRADLDAMKLPQIEAAIPPGTTIIEYCVLEDRTYAWVITHDRCQFIELSASREAIERWSSTLQTAAHHYDKPAFEFALRAAYEKLIAPLLLSIQKPSNLVFVPDGAIHGLPIAALQDANSRRYVMQEGPVSIAASAKMYLHSLERDETMPRDLEPTELLVGDPAFDPRLMAMMQLGRLDLALQEVLLIQQIYGPNAKVLKDTDATVPAFLELAPQNTIVHVAAHAMPNAAEPSHSLLLLARSAGNSGALDGEQLLQKLTFNHTRLVVLSTCSSAGGLPVGPEGVAPLVRPLIAAGVPAVIGSLWEVSDATAEQLLVSFHRQYRQGNDAAVALRTAQLEMLSNRNPGLRSVLAWAPFQVIGHASSPFESPRRK